MFISYGTETIINLAVVLKIRRDDTDVVFLDANSKMILRVVFDNVEGAIAEMARINRLLQPSVASVAVDAAHAANSFTEQG
jgi:selenocysteine lyase/cysteine desulfurase